MSTYCDTTVNSDTESRNNDGFEGGEHARELVVFELPPKMATAESNQLIGCKQPIKEIDLIDKDDPNWRSSHAFVDPMLGMMQNKEKWMEAIRIQ